MVEDAGGVAISEFQLIIALLGVAGTAFAGWLYRHERWFRDRVFPLHQVLTGKSSDGSDVDPTSEGGLLNKQDERLDRVERAVMEIAHTQDDLQENVQDLSRTQKRHNRQTEGYLRRIANGVEGDDLDRRDEDEPLFRGGGRSNGQTQTDSGGD